MVACIATPSADMTVVEFWQVEPILRAARASDVNVEQLLEQIGLPANLDQIPKNSEIRIADYFRLNRDIARGLDDLTAKLSERKLTYQTGSYIVSQIQSAKTLQDTMRGLVDHFNMMHGDAYNSIRTTTETLSLVIDDSTFPYTYRDDENLTHFVGDCLAITLHSLLDSLSNGLAEQALRRVGLVRKREDAGARQNTFWRVPIRYRRPAYELVYDFDLACRTINVKTDIDLTTSGIYSHVIAHLESHGSAHHHRSYTARTLELIANGTSQQSSVAKQLGISVATLRRRLDAEKTGFRDLVRRVRLERAEALLMRGRTVAQVSEQLNYSDVRAFNRAFKKWKGLTPAAFTKTATDMHSIAS